MIDIAWMTAQPWLLPAVALITVAAATILWRAQRRGPKDTRRMYTSEERAQGFARAGGQCEYDRWLFFRCTRTAEHGDHFYPWSKGGATSMQNFVGACARCNLAKSAHMPSALQRARIQSRRASYFPAGVPLTVGEWNRRGKR